MGVWGANGVFGVIGVWGWGFGGVKGCWGHNGIFGHKVMFWGERVVW